jgi:hypothetical protein
MVQYYRSAILGLFIVLSAILVGFLLAISKKGANVVSQIVGNNPIPTIPSNPSNERPTIPPTSNELPPATIVALTITSGNYELTSPARNIIVQAAPLNGVIMVFINPVVGSAGRQITVVNTRILQSDGTITIMGRNGVQIQGAPINVLSGNNSVTLVALRDNAYIVRTN